MKASENPLVGLWRIVEGYNQASGYLRQLLAWIGITDVEIILADRGRAGGEGETAVERFGDTVRSAAAA